MRTQIRPSKIPGAGNGLWLLEKAVEGDVVGRLSGEVIDVDEAAKREQNGEADYILHINENLYLDASAPPTPLGRSRCQ